MDNLLETKICKACLNSLPITDFYIHTPGNQKRRHVCKKCMQSRRVRSRVIGKEIVLPQRTDSELAWAAGIIEGEGYIGVSRGKSGYGLSLTVSNSDLYMLAELRRLFFGNFNPHSGGTTSRKALWMWNVHGRHAGAVLEQVLPYMRTSKKKQAELAIEYSKRFSQYLGFRCKNEQRHIEQQWYYERMKALKNELPTLETVEV